MATLLLASGLATGCFGFWIWNAIDRWERASVVDRAVIVSIGFLLASIAYLSGAAINNTVPLQVRALLLAAPLACLLLSLIWDRHHLSQSK